MYVALEFYLKFFRTEPNPTPEPSLFGQKEPQLFFFNFSENQIPQPRTSFFKFTDPSPYERLYFEIRKYEILAGAKKICHDSSLICKILFTTPTDVK